VVVGAQAVVGMAVFWVSKGFCGVLHQDKAQHHIHDFYQYL
jgi:hypothetical protein